MASRHVLVTPTWLPTRCSAWWPTWLSTWLFCHRWWKWVDIKQWVMCDIRRYFCHMAMFCNVSFLMPGLRTSQSFLLMVHPSPQRAPVQGWWWWCHPHQFFLEWRLNRLADRSEIMHSWWGILRATFGENISTGSCQVTELWRHKRYSLRPIFQGTRLFSHVTWYH